MWRATLSSLLAHKLRLALTTLAVVLGVAFVAGTLIYTDTVRSSFDTVFGQITGSVDLSVRGVSRLADAEGGDPFAEDRPGVPPAVADRVAEVDGVAAVERNVEGFAQIIGDDGRPLTSDNGPPALGFNAPLVEELSPTELRRGRYPTAADEVTIDAGTAAEQGIAVGDTVQIAANGPVTAYEVVGIFGFDGDVDNLAGAPSRCSLRITPSICSAPMAATQASTCSQPRRPTSTICRTALALRPVPIARSSPAISSQGSRRRRSTRSSASSTRCCWCSRACRCWSERS